MRRSLPIATAVLLMLTGCATSTPAPAESGSALGDGHGFVAGATEVADPPSTLVTVSREGEVSLRDLVSDETTAVGAISPPEQVAVDGRFVYAVRDGGVEVVDTGVWTQPHGDHVHYYRAEPRIVGRIDGTGLAEVTWAGDRTALLFGDGVVVLLDRRDLGEGDLEPLATFRDLEADVVIPLADGLLVGDAARGEVRKVSDEGETVGAPVACDDPRTAAASRPGTVVGCADGAVLAAGADLEGELERIPMDGDGPLELRSRADRAGLAGVAAPGDGVQLLDVRARTSSFLSSPANLVTAVAVDDADDHVLALGADGSLLVFSGDGTLVGRTEPLVAASLAAGREPRVDVDADRAYLVGAAEGTVWELDYRDSGRVARTFPMPVDGFAAEVGR